MSIFIQKLAVGTGDRALDDLFLINQGSPPITRLATRQQILLATATSTGQVGTPPVYGEKVRLSQLQRAIQVYVNDLLIADQGTPPITRQVPLSLILAGNDASTPQNSELSVPPVANRLFSQLPVATASYLTDWYPINQNLSDGRQVTKRVQKVKPKRVILSALKTQALATASVGDQQTYTITVTNNGPDPGDGILVDVIPAELTFVSCSLVYGGGAAGAATATANDLAAGIYISPWPVGGTVTATIVGIFNNTGSITNSVTASVVDSSEGSSTSSVITTVNLPWILLSNFESPDSGTSVTDESIINNTPTMYSDTYDEPGTHVTAVRAKFGTQSWGVVYQQAQSFSNRTIVYPQNAAYQLPGAFTLVYYVWPDGTFSQYFPDVYCAASILDFSANPYVQFGTWLLNSRLNVYINNVSHTVGGSGNNVPPGQWSLIEISRQINGDGSATLRSFINGVKIMEEPCSNATLVAQQITISGFVKNGLLPNIYAGGGSDPKCYDSVGLLKGIAVHTNSYTPPTVPFTRTMSLADMGT